MKSSQPLAHRDHTTGERRDGYHPQCWMHHDVGQRVQCQTHVCQCNHGDRGAWVFGRDVLGRHVEKDERHNETEGNEKRSIHAERRCDAFPT